MTQAFPVAIVTNDDGIDAPGIAALVEAIEGLCEVHVVAPLAPRSGCGHTVETSKHIPIHRRRKGWIAVDANPADCVRLALHSLVPNANLVLSGINDGGNLGVDVYYSGTVSAAREAALHGIHAIALSHYIAQGRSVDWQAASRLTRRLVETYAKKPLEPLEFWNINLPHPTTNSHEVEIVECPVDLSAMRLDYTYDDHGRGTSAIIMCARGSREATSTFAFRGPFRSRGLVFEGNRGIASRSLASRCRPRPRVNAIIRMRFSRSTPSNASPSDSTSPPINQNAN